MPDTSNTALLSWTQPLRETAQACVPDWVLDQQMRLNCGLGLASFGATLMASGVGKTFTQTNPYRMAIVPVGLTAMGLGLTFKEHRLSESEVDALRMRSLPGHFLQSVRDGFNPADHIFQTSGLLNLTIAGLQLAAYRYEGNPAFRGELIGAGVAGLAGLGMLGARDPANGWQVRSLSYLGGFAPEAAANWKLYAHAVDAATRHKGGWLLAKTVIAGSAHSMGFLLGGASKDTPDTRVSEAARPAPALTSASPALS